MAEDASFRVKNTLVVNGSFIANATTVVANAVNATSVNTATANATTSIVVGANVTINTSAVFIGTTSVNAIANSSTIRVSNSTTNTAIDSASIATGNSTVNVSINSTSIALGSTGSLRVGNTTVNAVVNSTSIALGNSTVNAAANSTTLVVANATTRTVLGTTDVRVGNTSVNVIISNTVSSFGGNVSVSGVANVTGNVTLGSSGLFVGNGVLISTVNATSITTGTLPDARLSGAVVNTSGNFTVAGNINFTAANVNFTSINVGANVDVNTTAVFVGNSTVNTVVNSTSISTGNSTVNVTINSTSITVTSDPLVQQSDIGTAPDQVPLNQYLGTLAYQSDTVAVSNTFTIGSAAVFVANGNVGIGNSAPDATLAVTGAANVSGNVVIGGSLNAANVTATVFTGALTGTASNATNLNSQPGSFYTNATNLSTGTVPTARLGSGTANSTTFLSGDQSYKTAVTSVAAGNGLSGGTITTTGTVAVLANSGLVANATGLHVGAGNGITTNLTAVAVLANNGIVANSTGTFVHSNSGIIANTSGVFVNASSIAVGTVPTARLGSGTANSTTFLSGDQSYKSAVTSVATGNGLTGGTITTTGTAAVLANNGIVANSTGTFVLANTGLVANATGVHVNSAYIGTLGYALLSGATFTGPVIVSNTLSVSNSVTITGNLIVTGTTMYANVTNLDVKDLNITIAKGVASAAAADGAGLTVDTANVTWNYNHGTASWQSNVGITPASNNNLSLGSVNLVWANVYANNLIGGGLLTAANLTTTTNTATIGTAAYFVANGNVGIGVTTPTAKLDVAGTNVPLFETVTTDSVGDQDLLAHYLDVNMTGTDTLTTNREHSALRIDVDATATGGNTTNQHLVRGIYNTVDVTGTSSQIYGIDNRVRTTINSGTVSVIYAALNACSPDPGVGGTVATAFGSMNQAYAGGAGVIDTIYGTRNEAVIEGTATAGVVDAYGAFNEIEVDGNTLTNGYATRSVMNIDGGVTTNAFLYYGDYQGANATNVLNSWGLYLSGATKNYISGNVGINNTAPNATLAVTGTANVSGNVVIGGSLNAANVTATVFTGNLTGTASNATNLNSQPGSFYTNATNITTGTLATARLPATVNVATQVNVGANVGLSTDTLRIGNSSVNTAISAGSLTFNGINVNTAITGNASTAYTNAIAIAANATNLTSGTVNASRLSGTYTITVTGTASNATNLNSQPGSFYTNATNLATGTVPTARLGSGTANSTTFLAGDQTYKTAVTSVATGNGLSGGTITSTGTISVLANSGLVANATGLHVGAGNGITTNLTSVAVLANTGIVANATGVYVNSAYIGTLAPTLTGTGASGTWGISISGTASNATNLNSQPGSFYTNATNITTGTLPAARLSGTYTITVTGTASNATNLNSQPGSFYTNATNISTGTLNTARLPATANITTAVNVGANVNLTTTSITVNNATAKTTYGSDNLEITSYGSTDISYVTRKAGGTAASPTATPSEGRLGYLIGATTNNGTTFLNTASMELYADSTANSTSHPTSIRFSTTPSGSTTRAERVRINSSGRVGIGTTNPQQLLEVNGGADATRIRIAGANSSGIEFVDSNTGVILSGTNQLDFFTAGAVRARLTSAGDLQFNSGYGTIATAYGCRAWVNFNGTGTVAIRASGGVSSITDNGTGDYTVNFTSAMPDASYSYSHAYSNEINVQHTIGFLHSMSSSALRVSHYSAVNSANTADKAFVNIAVFR